MTLPVHTLLQQTSNSIIKRNCLLSFRIIFYRSYFFFLQFFTSLICIIEIFRNQELTMHFSISSLFSFSIFFLFFAELTSLGPSKLDSVKDEIVALHNQKRSQVSPPATHMKPMKWDDGLARIAQKWSEGISCGFAVDNNFQSRRRDSRTSCVGWFVRWSVRP